TLRPTNDCPSGAFCRQARRKGDEPRWIRTDREMLTAARLRNAPSNSNDSLEYLGFGAGDTTLCRPNRSLTSHVLGEFRDVQVRLYGFFEFSGLAGFGKLSTTELRSRHILAHRPRYLRGTPEVGHGGSVPLDQKQTRSRHVKETSPQCRVQGQGRAGSAQG